MRVAQEATPGIRDANAEVVPEGRLKVQDSHTQPSLRDYRAVDVSSQDYTSWATLTPSLRDSRQPTFASAPSCFSAIRLSDFALRALRA